MFCLYCGMTLPNDAVFCNRCGKRQDVAANEPATEVTALPLPVLPEALSGNIQAPVGHVPIVQGTPSPLGGSSGQNPAHSAANAASPSLPSQAASSASQVPPQHAKPQALSSEPQAHHQIEPRTHLPHMTMPPHIESPTSSTHYPDNTDQRVSPPGRLKLVAKPSPWRKITIISSLVVIAIVISVAVIEPKLATHSTAMLQIANTITTPTLTPDNTLCSGDTSGSPMSSGKIDKSHPFHEDDGQAAQGDQGSFSPIALCTKLAASSYAISFHATSPYILLYLYDSNHTRYEIDYNIYPDHISAVTHPGFSIAGTSVGEGTYSSADWHTYRIEFTSNFVRVLVDGTEVLSGPAGFTDDGSGDDLLLQSHQITMDQFSVTRI